jgi:hypothetical protein
MAALFRLELSDPSEVLNSVFSTLAAWLCGAEQAPLRRSIAAWIKRLLKREFRGVTIEEVEGALEGKEMGERFARKYATWADAFEDKGLQRGLEQGRVEGRGEGMRELLKRQLIKRFESVPVSIAARIDQATEADVERWGERLLDAGSIDAVFSG